MASTESPEVRAIRRNMKNNRRKRERVAALLEKHRDELDELAAEGVRAGLDITDIARELGVSRWTLYSRGHKGDRHD